MYILQFFFFYCILHKMQPWCVGVYVYIIIFIYKCINHTNLELLNGSVHFDLKSFAFQNLFCLYFYLSTIQTHSLANNFILLSQ